MWPSNLDLSQTNLVRPSKIRCYFWINEGFGFLCVCNIRQLLRIVCLPLTHNEIGVSFTVRTSSRRGLYSRSAGSIISPPSTGHNLCCLYLSYCNIEAVRITELLETSTLLPRVSQLCANQSSTNLENGHLKKTRHIMSAHKCEYTIVQHSE